MAVNSLTSLGDLLSGGNSIAGKNIGKDTGIQTADSPYTSPSGVAGDWLWIRDDGVIVDGITYAANMAIQLQVDSAGGVAGDWAANQTLTQMLAYCGENLVGPSVPISAAAFASPGTPTELEVKDYVEGLASFAGHIQNQIYTYENAAEGVDMICFSDADGTMHCSGGVSGGGSGGGSGMVELSEANYIAYDDVSNPDPDFVGYWDVDVTSLLDSQGAAATSGIVVSITDAGTEVYNSGSVPVGTDLSTVGTASSRQFWETGSTISNGGNIRFNKAGFVAAVSGKYTAEHTFGLVSRSVQTATETDLVLTVEVDGNSDSKILGVIEFLSGDNASGVFSPATPWNSIANPQTNAVGGFEGVFTDEPPTSGFALSAGATVDSALEIYRVGSNSSNRYLTLGGLITSPGPVITEVVSAPDGDGGVLADPAATGGVWDWLHAHTGSVAVITNNGIAASQGSYREYRSTTPGKSYAGQYRFKMAPSGSMVSNVIEAYVRPAVAMRF